MSLTHLCVAASAAVILISSPHLCLPSLPILYLTCDLRLFTSNVPPLIGRRARQNNLSLRWKSYESQF